MIKYHKMDLFEAPLGSVIAHAVNCRGQFRSGIAAEFKKRYPNVFHSYEDYCEFNGKKNLGTALLCQVPKYEYVVANLFTSFEESANKDPEELILMNTVLAVNDLLSSYDARHHGVYSCKINSGHFGVPWEKTAAIIEELSNRYGIVWNVCNPSLDTIAETVDNKNN